MIALSPPRAVGDGMAAAPTDDFMGFSGEDLLVDIDFDDLFVDFDDGDLLPDLELDSDGAPAAESPSAAAGNEDPSGCGLEELKRAGEEEETPGEKGRKAPSQGKSSSGKKKGKVDWTPELHRRFVQAVEQLGLDKAVPSRILEVMGIDCLTRHNIASHLQKYRSHRKHMLTRESESASWSHRRQAPSIIASCAAAERKRETAPWVQQPTMGFPPSLPPPAMQPFRPLHVWGHPTVGHAMVHMWPKHMVPSRSPQPPQGPPPPAIWAPPPHPPQPDPSFWHHPQYPRGPNILTQGTPCFAPQPLAAPAVQRFPPVAHFQSYSRQPMYTNNKAPPDHIAFPSKQLQLDSHPDLLPGTERPFPTMAGLLGGGDDVYLNSFQSSSSKESIDAALGDVLSKPWLPLPLGLKPPSVESVLGELQRQGVSSIPPSCA